MNLNKSSAKPTEEKALQKLCYSLLAFKNRFGRTLQKNFFAGFFTTIILKKRELSTEQAVKN
jgi:hypothetical protein